MSIGAASSLPFTAALLATLIVGSSAIWGACALWFQVQGGQALKALSVLLWAGFSLTLTIALWQGRTAAGLVTFTAAFGALLIWWQRIAPSNDRIWADDVAQMTTGTVDGNRITLRNVPNFVCRSNTVSTPSRYHRNYDHDRQTCALMSKSY